MTERPRRNAVQPGAAARRRAKVSVPRANRITARYSDEEFAAVEEYAGAAGLALAAYVAEAALRPSAWRVEVGAGSAEQAEAAVPPAGPVLDDAPSGVEARQLLLLQLLGMHRQLRGIGVNLNQAVAKLHSLGKPVGELPAIAAYVRRVTTAVDETLAEVRIRR